MKIHHIGIACQDIQETISEFERFHTIIRRSEIVYDENQNASLCMVSTGAGVDIEFIAGERVARMVKKGIGYYHLCYEVDDLNATIEDYVSRGAMMISEPKPAVLFGGKRVTFLHLPYGLVELVEK